GRAVDKRADIWAFAVVLYEMLTGRAAFAGETVTDTLSAVVSREPDWTALASGTPASVKRLLARCLDKDPKRRLRDIGDARMDLELADTDAVPSETQVLRRSRWLQAAPWIVAALLAVAWSISLARARWQTADPMPVRRFTLSVPARSAANWGDFDVALS